MAINQSALDTLVRGGHTSPTDPVFTQPALPLGALPTGADIAAAQVRVALENKIKAINLAHAETFKFLQKNPSATAAQLIETYVSKVGSF